MSDNEIMDAWYSFQESAMKAFEVSGLIELLDSDEHEKFDERTMEICTAIRIVLPRVNKSIEAVIMASSSEDKTVFTVGEH
jgi:hypothetical protein